MELANIKRILIYEIQSFLLRNPNSYKLTREDIEQYVNKIVKNEDCAYYKDELIKACLIRFERDLNRDLVSINISIVGEGQEVYCNINRQLLPRYDKYLDDVSKRIGFAASNTIEATVDRIFNRIHIEHGDVVTKKGLVLGHVQSGKTANYIGLAAKAIDVGYRVVIILTSNNTALREQTQRRVNRDLIGSTSLFPSDTVVNWEMSKRELDDYLCPIQGDRPGFEQMLPKSLTSRVDFYPKDQPDGILTLSRRNNSLFLIIKKHATKQNINGVLNKLNGWLANDADESGKVPLRCLVIDDECDSSTPNSARQVSNAGDVSSVHGEVFRLVSLFKQCSYVGYTATPFANVFMDRDAPTSLYPKDFIMSLPKPENYMGDEEFFSGRHPKVYQGVAKSDLDIFCDLGTDLPQSAKTSIKQFVARRIEVLARVNDDTFEDLVKDPWTSMIIHVSRRVFDQRIIYTKVREFVNRLNKDEIWIEHRQIENRRPIDSSVFNSIYDECIDSLKILEINGNGDSLDYGNNDYPFLICVGGDIISRGLTIEGLTTSYYLRDSSNYDSLLQMGRWFGYRNGYDDLIRLFTTKDIYEKFKFLVEVNSQLRDVIESYSIDPTKTPYDIAPAVLAHESMMPTGRMGAALDVSKVNGMLYQTLYFSNVANEQNVYLVKDFVISNGIKVSTPQLESTKVAGLNIREFVMKYSHSGLENKVVADNLKVVKNKICEYEDLSWDVTIHSLKGEGSYRIGDINIKPVSRSLKHSKGSTLHKAKVITDPDQTHSEYKGVPRLVLYFVDSSENSQFTSEVIVGYSIRFPERTGADSYYQQIFTNGNN